MTGNKICLHRIDLDKHRIIMYLTSDAERKQYWSSPDMSINGVVDAKQNNN